MKRALVALLLTCFASTGIGLANAGAQETTPCDLLTRAEIKGVFDGRTAKGERNGAICTYRVKGGSAKRNGADLELTAAGKASVDYFFNPAFDAAPVGDEAYFAAGGPVLGVKEGDTTLLLLYEFDPERTSRALSVKQIRARLVEVAEYALERCRPLAPDYPCGGSDIP
jgi:hypothetical protein